MDYVFSWILRCSLKIKKIKLKVLEKKNIQRNVRETTKIEKTICDIATLLFNLKTIFYLTMSAILFFFGNHGEFFLIRFTFY